MASTYTVGQVSKDTFELTAVDASGFTSREIVSREEAEQLTRKLIIALYRPERQMGVSYTSVSHNGLTRRIDPVDADEIAEQKAQEKAEEDYLTALKG